MTLKTAIKGHLIAVLIVGTIISPLPQLALAIVLLAIQLYTTYKPPAPKISLVSTVGTLIFAPLTLVSLTGNALSCLLIIPAMYLLDCSLRENAASQFRHNPKTARIPTQTLTMLAVALLVVFVASLLLLNHALVFTSAALLVYFVVALSIDHRGIPKKPLKESRSWNRILAGNTENTLMSLTLQAKTSLNIQLTAPQPWVKIEPSNVTATPKNPIQIRLTYAPPLAGPTKLQIQALIIDPHGLIQTQQTLEPLNLHIIPKAKYAQWLAKKYLEQTASGTSSTAAAPSLRALKAAKQGVEFYGSRLYQAGDRLKDVDWKHALMLNELIVKEFAGIHGTPTIIVADLTAKDEKDADTLIYKVVMSALTAATESLPTGLACFNQKEILAVHAPTTPRETLKKTLKTTEKTTITPQPSRVIEPTEIQTLKRTLKALSQTQTDPAVHLAELSFECKAYYAATKAHPATMALTKCVERSPKPSVLTVTSMGYGDSEALVLILERLKARGYGVVKV